MLLSAVGVELLQVGNVHNLVLNSEVEVVEAALRAAGDNRVRATLITPAGLGTAAGAVALGAAAGRLALAAASAAAQALMRTELARRL